LEVFVFGSTAIVSSKVTVTMVVKGKSRSMPSSGVNTYALDKGIWRMVASQMPPEPSAEQPYSPQDVNFDLTIDPALIKGNKAAAVVMIEFVDYQCPLCRKFAAETMGRIQADYVTSGKVAVVAKNMPLEDIHPLAFGAARAAECAKGQGKFWEMDERLLLASSALAPADLKVHAGALGLDLDRFNACLEDEKTTSAIRRDKTEAARFGITGTPYFLIGVRKPDSTEVKAVRMVKGAFPYEVFKGALDTVLYAQGQ
jgi:protein-disulfide isomerase